MIKSPEFYHGQNLLSPNIEEQFFHLQTELGGNLWEFGRCFVLQLWDPFLPEYQVESDDQIFLGSYVILSVIL